MPEDFSNASQTGAFRRLIDLRRAGDGQAVGWLEDGFHHFGLTLSTREGRITDVRVEAIRAPWTSCPGAAEPLRRLIGQAVPARATQIGGLIDMRLQCTHLFDLAGLLLGHLASGREHRRYHALVDDRVLLARDGNRLKLGAGHARLWRDAAPCLHWQIEGSRIASPTPLKGISLNTGFRAWTESLPEEEAEAATVLRRAIMVATGRAIDLDEAERASEAPIPVGACHSYQPGVSEHGLRNRGSTRDYSASEAGMLAQVDRLPG
jgi:hypothetical protein